MCAQNRTRTCTPLSTRTWNERVYHSATWAYFCGRLPFLERKTRLELATPTLARLCSTNWAISAIAVQIYVWLCNAASFVLKNHGIFNTLLYVLCVEVCRSRKIKVFLPFAMLHCQHSSFMNLSAALRVCCFPTSRSFRLSAITPLISILWQFCR